MAKLTVLGIGNILMRDEGIGALLAEAVKIAHDWPKDVEFVDGGAGGLNLLNIIESADRLIVFDAAEMQLHPGGYRIISPQQLPAELPQHRVSMHDVPFLETLNLCENFAKRPEDVTIMAIQPGNIEFGRELSQELSSSFGKLVEVAIGLINKSLQ